MEILKCLKCFGTVLVHDIDIEYVPEPGAKGTPWKTRLCESCMKDEKVLFDRGIVCNIELQPEPEKLKLSEWKTSRVIPFETTKKEDPKNIIQLAKNILEVEITKKRIVQYDPLAEMPKPYYDEDGITIYNNKCEEVIKCLNDNSIDFILTDPPYAEKTHKRVKTGSVNVEKNAMNDLDLGFSSIAFDDLAGILNQLGRISKRWVVFTCDLEHACKIYLDPSVLSDLECVRFGVYDKLNHAPSFCGVLPAQEWEPLMFLHKNGMKKSWNSGGHGSVYREYHPTKAINKSQKSESMYSKLIKDFSNHGDLIFDPFMGGGTSVIAAKKLGRKAIGVEMREQQCEEVVKLLRQTQFEFNTRITKAKQEKLF